MTRQLTQRVIMNLVLKPQLYPPVLKPALANILNNYYNLLEADIQKSTILNNPWLLTHENNKLMDKLDCIKILNMDNNQLVPWLLLTQKELENYVFHVQQDMNSYTYNKLEYLSHKLECNVQKLCEVTLNNPFLLKIPVSSIEKKLNILYEYNVSKKDVLKDVWVLRYSENHIRHRCELYKNTGKLNTKTWAIRCPLKVISRAIEKSNVERNLMQQYENVSEYLQNKLKVSEEMLNLVTQKLPSILRVNIAKLDQLIDILHQNGITSDEILRHPRIFYFNVDTVQNRIRILKKEGLTPNLGMLKQAEQIFDRQLDIIIARRNLVEKYGSIKNYLLDQLNVDEKILDAAIAKYPSILRINVKKLKKLINLLRQNGITSNDIVSHPKIFHFKVETLRERIERLKKDDIPLTINLIMCNRRTLERHVKLKSHNSKNT
ncbi:transcription termination factor, mitochondrial isoform X2 [Monomorium pharaonis]|uniref:transcription termination factor, mitochondrial isoform X2 n=1 Tax=Monomorium pharaonis TaxID=307658 RepID=UPI0017464858|nr:transcription termination factor, mitochondrial isoform X2 [Monomorium pharaonis]